LRQKQKWNLINGIQQPLVHWAFANNDNVLLLKYDNGVIAKARFSRKGGDVSVTAFPCEHAATCNGLLPIDTENSVPEFSILCRTTASPHQDRRAYVNRLDLYSNSCTITLGDEVFHAEHIPEIGEVGTTTLGPRKQAYVAVPKVSGWKVKSYDPKTLKVAETEIPTTIFHGGYDTGAGILANANAVVVSMFGEVYTVISANGQVTNYHDPLFSCPFDSDSFQDFLDEYDHFVCFGIDNIFKVYDLSGKKLAAYRLQNAGVSSGAPILARGGCLYVWKAATDEATSTVSEYRYLKSNGDFV